MIIESSCIHYENDRIVLKPKDNVWLILFVFLPIILVTIIGIYFIKDSSLILFLLSAILISLWFLLKELAIKAIIFGEGYLQINYFLPFSYIHKNYNLELNGLDWFIDKDSFSIVLGYNNQTLTVFKLVNFDDLAELMKNVATMSNLQLAENWSFRQVDVKQYRKSKNLSPEITSRFMQTIQEENKVSAFFSFSEFYFDFINNVLSFRFIIQEMDKEEVDISKIQAISYHIQTSRDDFYVDFQYLIKGEKSYRNFFTFNQPLETEQHIYYRELQAHSEMKHFIETLKSIPQLKHIQFIPALIQ